MRATGAELALEDAETLLMHAKKEVPKSGEVLANFGKLARWWQNVGKLFYYYRSHRCWRWR